MYLALKLLHVAAVIVFLGNITTGLFWHAHAARTRDPKLLAHTMDGIIRSDRLFTLPGVLLISPRASVLAVRTLPVAANRLDSVDTRAVRDFRRRIRCARRADAARAQGARRARMQGGFDYARYRALALRWEIWGAVALLTPVAGLALMILKPF